jgi:tetratricopeptide (TPR) repeat protein
MIQAPLQMRYDPQQQRQACAWLIPDEDPREWLDELTGWQVPLADVKLHIVPRGRNDLTPQGLLAVPPAGVQPHVSPRCFPYASPGQSSRHAPSAVLPLPENQGFRAGGARSLPARMGVRLYVPVDARFDPEVSESELAELLGEGTFVWHPAVGLVGYESHDVLHVCDLLAPPLEQPVDWGQAQPGMAFSRRLLAVELDDPPRAEQVLQAGRDDIGTQAPEIERLPPSPDEPADDVPSRAARSARRSLARAVRWLTGLVPHTGTARTWINDVEDWAERQLGAIQSALDASRHREIVRLLGLLESNPDEGLRFALPLADLGHRGVAPPSGRLGRRNVDFNLNRLGGGHAGDAWYLPWDYHQRLITRYRDLAAREIRLGRHRRAAYIYAELLGDLPAAANTLASGGHWREAAVLYRQRLNNPAEAARCLERGGLWAEAIALYEELREYEQAGDLYLRLEQHDSARRSYRLAVEKLQSSGNHLAAARLLDEKLRAPDEALAELDLGWRTSSQATQCLQESFALRARLGRHEESRRRVLLLREPSQAPRVLELLEVLPDLATGYPDDAVRSAAADTTRVVSSRALPQATPLAADRIVSAVARLAPEDRLLRRDCRRYLAPRSRPAPPPVRKPPPRSAARLLREIALPSGVDWKAAIPAGEAFYAAGYKENHVFLVRGDWQGKIQSISRPAPGNAAVSSHPISLGIDPSYAPPLYLHIHGWPLGFFPLDRPASKDFPFAVSTLPICWAADQRGANVLLGWARTGHGVHWLVRGTGPECELTLECFGPDDALINSISLEFPDSRAELPGPLPLHARREGVFVGLGWKLLVLWPNQRTSVIELPSPIHTLVGSAPFSRPRVVATCDQGAALYWADRSAPLVHFAEDLHHPIAVFTRGGWLILAESSRCELYRAQDRRIVLESTLATVQSPPVALLTTSHADQFALLTADGVVRVYEPARG